MAGPPPKDPSQRRRRNAPARGEWVTLSDEPYRGPKPKLTHLAIHGKLSQEAKDAWKQWWASPMAHQWEESDWPRLRMLVALVDRIWKLGRTEKAPGLTSLLSEKRQLEDSLGLSEKGRRDLRWRLPDEDDVAAQRPSRSSRDAKRDARREETLKLVQGGKQ